MVEPALPYGVPDLDPRVVVHPEDPDRVRCYVRGCQHFLRRPTRYARGEECPDHGIYCHYSRYGATYSYRDVRRKIIASPDLFAQQGKDWRKLSEEEKVDLKRSVEDE